MTRGAAFGGDHEDPEMLAVMQATLAGQRATLDAWGYAGVGLLHLLSSCHGGCFFCSNRSLREMPAAWVTTAEVVRARLAGLEALGLTTLVVGGTEPVTHPELPHVLAAARAAGVPVELMTSGLELATPGFAADLAAAGVSRVAVPLYAPVAAWHDDVVGRPGQHATVVQGLDAAVAAGLGVDVHTLALRRTLSAIPALAAWVRGRWGAALSVAPVRRKDDLFSYADEVPAYREIEDAVAGAEVHLVGFPRCVAPETPRGGSVVIELYFRTQRLAHPAACDACVLRSSCRGAVPAHVEIYGEREVRPVLTPPR